MEMKYMKNIFPVIFLFSLSLGACGKTVPGPVEGAASMPELWTLPLQGHRRPTLYKDQIITSELDETQTKDLHVTAVNLDTRTVAWTANTKFYGEETVEFDGFLISFNGIDALEVRDQTGVLKRSVKLPDGLLTGTNNHLITNQLQAIGDNLILPLDKAVLAYKLSAIIAADTVPLVPIWRYTPVPKPGYRVTIGDVAYDSISGLLFTSDRESNSVTRMGDTSLSTIDPKDGSLKWRKVVNHTDNDDVSSFGTVGAGGGLGYIHLVGQYSLSAYDISGTIVWTNPNVLCPDPRTNGSFTLPYVNGILFVAVNGDHCMGALDATSGKTKFVFNAPKGGTFAQRPLVLNNVMYATNGYLWAVDMNTGNVLGQSGDLGSTQFTTGTVLYDQKRNQLLTWGDGLRAFKPLK
jgi:outer membrane protein assembly factor BamB